MREVVITETAKIDLEFIATFLEINYSSRVKMDFLVKFTEQILLIEKMPFMYQASTSNPLVRRCVVHKNASFFYKVTDEHIFILSIVDTRSDNSGLV